MNELNDIESQMSQKSESKLEFLLLSDSVPWDETRLGKRGSEESLLACSGVMSSSSMVGKLSGVVGLINIRGYYYTWNKR
jgi:hypothetical protein